MNQIDQLGKIKALLDSGVIDQNEFQKLKVELLQSSNNELLKQNNKAQTKITLTQSKLYGFKKNKRKRNIFLGISITFLFLFVVYFLLLKNNSYDSFPTDNNLPKTLLNKIPVTLLDGKSIKLSEFTGNITDTAVLGTFFAKFIDLDNDGIRELIVGYNNGGNAAIETNGIFVNENNNGYKQILNYDGDMTFGNNKIDFNFNCHTKYFHACGACNIWVPNELVPTFSLGYKTNNLFYLTDYSLNEKIKKNLDYLKRKGNFTSDSFGVDNGTRKVYIENLVELFFNNKGDLELTQNTFYQYYHNSDSNQIWEEIKNQILDLKKCFNIQSYNVPKNVNTNVIPNNPIDIFAEFKASLSNGNFESAQQYIYSNGVYFFENGLIKKEDFTQSKIYSLRGCFEFNNWEPEMGTPKPKDNSTGKQMLDFIFKDGIINIDDNFSHAAGFDALMESPHLDFNNWEKRGGYFKEGSKIVSVFPAKGTNIGDFALLIEFYPDSDGKWKIYSIGKWMHGT